MKLPEILRALALDCGVGQRQQIVGGLAHGGDHHHRAAFLARLDDARNAFNGGGRFHRAAAELHDDHQSNIPCIISPTSLLSSVQHPFYHQSNIPSECISSAFNTAAPAAPRTVLWVIATNL